MIPDISMVVYTVYVECSYKLVDNKSFLFLLNQSILYLTKSVAWKPFRCTFRSVNLPLCVLEHDGLYTALQMHYIYTD